MGWNAPHTVKETMGAVRDRWPEIAAWIAEEVVGHALYGHVSKAGPRPRGDQVYPIDMPFVESLHEASHFMNGPSVYQGQLSPWSERSALNS